MLLSIEEHNPGADSLAGIWSDLGLPRTGALRFMSAFECWRSSQGGSRARSNAVQPSLLRADGSAHSASKTADGHRTNRLSDRRLAITCSRISSGFIDMPPSGVTRSDCSLLRAAMKARSLACSEPDLLSRQTNSMHRHKKIIPLSIAVETWNAFSLGGIW